MGAKRRFWFNCSQFFCSHCKASNRFIVPLCDILVHVKDDSIEDNSLPVVKMKKTRQQKREREEIAESAKKKEKRELLQKRKFKEESESEDEKDDSFKENEENEISEYEKMVQKNREEKMAFLQSLKIDEVKEEFVQSVNSIKPKPKPRTPVAYKKPNVAQQPLRKSRRLAKLDIDLSEKAIYERAIAAIGIEEKEVLPSKYPFEEAISVKDDISEFVANFDFNVEDDVKFNSDYASNFKNMKIGESNVAKLVPTRITCLTVHPAPDKIMVVAGSKYGHLGFWNVTSHLHPILFLPHNGGITNLKVNPYNPIQLLSSSYDGTLRCADIEKKSFNEIYNVSDETSCTFFDFVSATTLLVSQRNGNVSVIDVRNVSSNSEKKHECHEYSVKTVHVHPGNKNLFLTADSKGNIKLWDLRKLQKKSLIDISHHKRSISSAFFSPASGKYILTTSADDSLCIFDSSNLEKEILLKKSIKHNNWTGRWLTPFKATWLPNSDELFSVGSMNYPRRIEIYNANGNNVFNFTNEEYLNSVTSANEFHPSMNVLAGGNSSGKVFIFADRQLNN